MSRIRVVGLWVFAALISFAAPAFADNDQGENNDDQGGRPHQTRSAPEIDPVAAGAVLAVVVGGTTVLAARRARRNKSEK
ncbi:MAG TPA: hypothetical protein VKQ32_28945 [Polyangia bacterium]|nr:hypothetical protein [Polyangia bacterium]